jgi:hypothetical protein
LLSLNVINADAGVIQELVARKLRTHHDSILFNKELPNKYPFERP